MIKILKNSKTQSFTKLKTSIMGSNFPWTYSQSVSRGEFNAEDVLYYEHPLYTRPEINGFSEPVSDYFQLSFKVMRDILTENDIDARRYFLLRMNINCTLPSDVPKFSRRHSDHSFDHMNFILYLTGNGGSTFVDRDIMDWEEHKPEEDQAILFSGEHYMQLPERGRRIILIATIMFH